MLVLLHLGRALQAVYAFSHDEHGSLARRRMKPLPCDSPAVPAALPFLALRLVPPPAVPLVRGVEAPDAARVVGAMASPSARVERLSARR